MRLRNTRPQRSHYNTRDVVGGRTTRRVLFSPAQGSVEGWLRGRCSVILDYRCSFWVAGVDYIGVLYKTAPKERAGDCRWAIRTTSCGLLLNAYPGAIWSPWNSLHTSLPNGEGEMSPTLPYGNYRRTGYVMSYAQSVNYSLQYGKTPPRPLLRRTALPSAYRVSNLP